jgi:hypothetical protein
MTKFEELCAAYAQSQGKKSKYCEDCHQLARQIAAGLMKYLEAPKDCVSFQKSEDQGAFLGLMHAGDDGSWNVTIRLVVYESPSISPKATNLLPLRIKKQNLASTQFTVALGAAGPEFVVGSDSPDSFEQLYEAIHQVILRGYTEGLEKLLAGKS